MIIDKFTKGLYAIKVLGKLPEEIQEELEDKGIKVVFIMQYRNYFY